MEEKRERAEDALLTALCNAIEVMKDTTHRVIIALIVSIIANVAIVLGFVYYELQFDVVATETITTTQELTADGENAVLNNVSGDQYNDNAVHNNEK